MIIFRIINLLNPYDTDNGLYHPRFNNKIHKIQPSSANTTE